MRFRLWRELNLCPSVVCVGGQLIEFKVAERGLQVRCFSGVVSPDECSRWGNSAAAAQLRFIQTVAADTIHNSLKPKTIRFRKVGKHHLKKKKKKKSLVKFLVPVLFHGQKGISPKRGQTIEAQNEGRRDKMSFYCSTLGSACEPSLRRARQQQFSFWFPHKIVVLSDVYVDQKWLLLIESRTTLYVNTENFSQSEALFWNV